MALGAAPVYEAAARRRSSSAPPRSRSVWARSRGCCTRAALGAHAAGPATGEGFDRIVVRPLTDMRARFRHKTRQTFGALHSSRNYRLYMIGQSISLTGTWMQTVAQAWLVLELTGSGTSLGLVIALQFLPVSCSPRSAG